METLTVIRSIWIDAPVSRVWHAVTEADQLSLWYSPGSPWEIPRLEASAEVLFHHSPNAYHTGQEVVTLRAEIVTVDRPNRFAMRWDWEGQPSAMVSTFILTAEKGGTRVAITETGYETKEQMEPTEKGYAMSLENLQAHVEGRSLPH